MTFEHTRNRRLVPLGWAVFGVLVLASCRGPITLTSLPPSPALRPTLTASPLPSPLPPSPTPPPELPTPTPTSVPCAGPVCVLPGHFMLAWPVPPPDAATLAYYPFGGTARGRRAPHHGLDLPAAQGDPVLAPAPGEVVFAGPDNAPEHLLAPWPNYYGQAVVLRHTFPGLPQPVFTLFGHLETITVTVGQQVAQGDLIGTVGSRGVAMGPHLHLEVRLGQNTYDAVQNPLLWLRPPEGMGVVAWRITTPQGNPIYFNGTSSAVSMASADASSAPLYLETYADPNLTGDPQWHETQALGNLPAGSYRLQVVALGCPHELLLTVEPARLTVVHWRLLPCP